MVSSTNVTVAEELLQSSYTLYLTVAVRMHKHGNSRTIAMRPNNVEQRLQFKLRQQF